MADAFRERLLNVLSRLNPQLPPPAPPPVSTIVVPQQPPPLHVTTATIPLRHVPSTASVNMELIVWITLLVGLGIGFSLAMLLLQRTRS